MSLLNDIVAIPKLLIENSEALSSKGFIFRFLLLIFLTNAFSNYEEKLNSPPEIIESFF